MFLSLTLKSIKNKTTSITSFINKLDIPSDVKLLNFIIHLYNNDIEEYSSIDKWDIYPVNWAYPFFN